MNLSHLRNWMQDEDCVVVGCGPSADTSRNPNTYDYNLDEHYREHWTIACNRAVQWLYRGTHPAGPDFAVCVEPPHLKDIWKLVREHAPMFVFSHVLHLRKGPIDCPRVVLLPDKDDVLSWMLLGHDGLDSGLYRKWQEQLGALICKQSPFYAVAVAAVMGFRRVGLIGVDFAPPRFSANPWRENKRWGHLRDVCADMGTELLNLSPTSRLESVPQGKWEDIRPKGWRQQTEVVK